MNKQIIPLNRGMNKNGGAFFCQNIAPARDDGVYAGLSLTVVSQKTSTSAVTDYLTTLSNFAQLGDFNTYAATQIFGKDQTSGDIHLINYTGTYICKAADYGQTNGAAIGICVSPQGELLYSGSQYIGKAFTTTLSGEFAASANTCDLTSASDFPNAGYGLVVEGNSLTKCEVFQWTGKSSNQLTGVTRGKYNTTNQTHAAGSEVFFFDDDWKNLGASDTSSKRIMKTWEDKTLIANGRYVATIDSSGTLDADALVLPTGYAVVDFGFLPTGSSSKILVCANKDETGSIFVWDGTDTKYMTQINLENISRAEGYYIATELGVYTCNGATVDLFWRAPDSDTSVFGKRFLVNDIKEKGEYVLIAGGWAASIRGMNGVWVVSKESRDSYFLTGGGLGKYNPLIYSIFNSSEYVTIFGSYYNGGAIEKLQNYPLANGSQYWYLFKPANAQTIKLKQIKLNIGTETSFDPYPHGDFNFDAVVRYYDFTRPFYQRNQLEAGNAETDAGTLVISDLCTPQVGDRIEIVGRDYASYLNAGCPRNITAVTAGSGKYTLTLDEDLPTATTTGTYNSGGDVSIIPLKKAGKVSVNGDIFLQDLSFDIPDQPEGKKFIFEIEIRNNDTTIRTIPELNYMEVYYDIID